jgi:hypothetical protein
MEQAITHIRRALWAGGALAMGRAGSQIFLLYRARAGACVQLLIGQYVRKERRSEDGLASSGNEIEPTR